MKLSLDSQEIYACSADGAQRINIKLLDLIWDMQRQDKTNWKKLSTYIFRACKGYVAPNDEAMNAFLQSNPMALEIAKKLPADPHEKLSIMRTLL